MHFLKSNRLPVPVADKKKKKDQYVGFFCDEETHKLIRAGSEICSSNGKPKQSEFLRRAIQAYFEK